MNAASRKDTRQTNAPTAPTVEEEAEGEVVVVVLDAVDAAEVLYQNIHPFYPQSAVPSPD